MTGSEHKDSVRKYQSIRENMTRLHGEIERMVFAAEIACHQECYEGSLPGCPFWRGSCVLPKVREMIGP